MPPSNALPEVHFHPLSGLTVIPQLKPYLPIPIALYRRIQFSHRSAHSYIISTVPPGELPEAGSCFGAAYVDRSRRPETEVWLFISSEVTALHAAPNGNPTEKGTCTGCKRVVLAIVQAISQLPYPPVEGMDKDSKNSPEAHANGYLDHVNNPKISLFGATSMEAGTILEECSLIGYTFPGMEYFYAKYIFEMAKLPPITPLPPGLHFAPLQLEHCAIVLSRTAIPRQAQTLMLLPSLGVFDKDTLIAWAFLGTDASLSSLHVEPAFRGKGLAKTLAVRLFREKSSLYNAGEVDGEAYTSLHCDVAPENHSSNGVCKSLGGQVISHVRWLRIDVTKAQEAIDALPTGTL